MTGACTTTTGPGPDGVIGGSSIGVSSSSSKRAGTVASRLISGCSTTIGLPASTAASSSSTSSSSTSSTSTSSSASSLIGSAPSNRSSSMITGCGGCRGIAGRGGKGGGTRLGGGNGTM